MVRGDVQMFTDFYEAWCYLVNHRIYKDKKYGFDHFQRHCLDINIVKVNPKNDTIEYDDILNTKTQVWLESGMYVDNDKQGMHDIDLDCGADTFEDAIIELANLVYEKYDKK
jgi:hypothetical protein